MKKKKRGRRVKAFHPLLLPLKESVAACMKESGWQDVEVAFNRGRINIKSLGRNGEPEAASDQEAYMVRLWGKSDPMKINVFGGLKKTEGVSPLYAAYDNFPRTLSLCNAIKSLPGVERATNVSEKHVRIVFVVDNLTAVQGVMFLTRCTDRRYWEYGSEWSISLSISDRPKESPITYLLESEAEGEEAYAQAQSLVENMLYHLNHKKFMEGYGLDISQFKGIQTFEVRG